MAESHGDPNAVGDGGSSYGLFQIHAPAHPDFDLSRAFDPAYNAQYAARLQASSGWGPWSTYNNGQYQNYLGQCGGIASNPGAAGGGGLSLPSSTTLLIGSALLLGGLLFWDSL